MIICHTHNFIFAKNRKVGSSSTEEIIRTQLDSSIDVWYGETGMKGENSNSGYNVSQREDPHTSIGCILTPNITDYFKCVVERNPWDQYVSFYDHQAHLGHNHHTPQTFFDFNYKIYMVDNKPIVNQIMRYENLREELREFADKVGITINENQLERIHLKGKIRKHSTKDFYDAHPKLKQQVENAAWFHINQLGYIFE